ncbi:hypothetical protein IEQ34_012159 [Dendrobium chrysotoxum]|uniref:Uncharacterized protein n=1 Tax=Dendrobium chrysotoxum TaxID=161865 RepID=A0AAV7GC47_DENCH|nr:hypothetical protein IEQ34_012159 [Dendrobium chrysotoxum]
MEDDYWYFKWTDDVEETSYGTPNEIEGFEARMAKKLDFIIFLMKLFIGVVLVDIAILFTSVLFTCRYGSVGIVYRFVLFLDGFLILVETRSPPPSAPAIGEGRSQGPQEASDADEEEAEAPESSLDSSHVESSHSRKQKHGDKVKKVKEKDRSRSRKHKHGDKPAKKIVRRRIRMRHVTWGSVHPGDVARPDSPPVYPGDVACPNSPPDGLDAVLSSHYLLPPVFVGWLFDVGAGICIRFLGRDKDDSVRRSAVSGKKILLKLEKSKEDKKAETNRNELLKFLNASYD